MIVSIETQGSSVRVEQDSLDNDMFLDDVFNLLIEPALLGFGFQKGTILDVCEQYIIDNGDEFITVSAAKAAEAKEYGEGDEEEEDDGEETEELKEKCSRYTSGYDKGYLAGLREASLRAQDAKYAKY